MRPLRPPRLVHSLRASLYLVGWHRTDSSLRKHNTNPGHDCPLTFLIVTWSICLFIHARRCQHLDHPQPVRHSWRQWVVDHVDSMTLDCRQPYHAAAHIANVGAITADSGCLTGCSIYPRAICCTVDGSRPLCAVRQQPGGVGGAGITAPATRILISTMVLLTALINLLVHVGLCSGEEAAVAEDGLRLTPSIHCTLNFDPNRMCF